MQTKQLNVKLMPELDKEIELVSEILHIPKVDWARNVLARQVKKDLEEHKSFVALEYMKGKISRTELVKFLGRKDAEDVDFIKRKTDESYKAAKELAKRLK